MNEPLIRVVKKAELGSRETFILRLEAILLALVAGGLFILIIGQNPFVIYKTIITGALRAGWPSSDGENCDSAVDRVAGSNAGV